MNLAPFPTDNSPAPLSDGDLARFREFCERHTDHRVKQMLPIDGNTLWRAKRGEPLRRPTRERILSAMEIDEGEAEAAGLLRAEAFTHVRRRAEELLVLRGVPVAAARRRAPALARFVLSRPA